MPTEKGTYFLELWTEQGLSLSSEQKDEIGRVYLRDVIGADDETIEGFVGDLKGSDYDASRFVMLRQNLVEPSKGDYSKFWRKVSEIDAGTYTPKELSWLIDEAGWVGSLVFLDKLRDKGSLSGVLGVIEGKAWISRYISA